MKILILCTGNSCRSQMAAGFLRTFDSRIEVRSAGTDPSSEVNAGAIKVMAEAGIDISMEKPKNVEIFLWDEWDYVITVCDDANETCPVFAGKVRQRLHISFEDPSMTTGTEEYVIGEFRRVRDLIRKKFREFYETKIKPVII